MIITILPAQRFKGLLPYIKDDENTFFISIRNPGDDIIAEDSENFKTWFFEDCEEDGEQPMTIEQASEMFDFVNANKNKTNLYVHCSLGVSRSGAVGETIFDYLGSESYQAFKRRNYSIVPNQYIKKIFKKFFEKNLVD